MLGLGWSEMLVIGVVALIVIGPKDLPVVMNRVGKIFGQIKRMGSEFQREINRSTGLSEVRNLRDSITNPLKQTAEEIRKEFNTMTPSGAKPSGVLKPTDPKVESVVDDIKAKAGMTTPPAAKADDVAKAAGFKPPAPAPTEPKTTLATKAPVKAAKTPTKAKAPATAKAAPTSPVVSTELPPLPVEPVAAPAKRKPAARKPAAAKPAAEAAAPTPAPRKRAPAKPKPAAAGADKAGEN